MPDFEASLQKMHFLFIDVDSTGVLSSNVRQSIGYLQFLKYKKKLKEKNIRKIPSTFINNLLLLLLYIIDYHLFINVEVC